MTSIDPFARTDELDEAVLEKLVQRFEARGTDPRFAHMLEEYLDAMEIDGAARVLDLGCGTGLVARAVARRPGFSGQATGIDLSSYLVEAAARLAAAEGVGDRTSFRAGDTRSLDLPEAEYDAVIAHTLLSHVADPASVIAEAARVLAPGGALAIFDGDYASLTFGHADPAEAARYDELLVGALVENPRAMRQMPRLLRDAGLVVEASFAHVLAEVGAADY